MRLQVCLFGALSLALVAACHHSDSSSTQSGTNQVLRLGDPLPNLTPDELAAFERGRAIFAKDFAASEGLGPLYNTTSCRACHSTPVDGGGSPLYRNFYILAKGTPAHQTPHPDLPSIVVPSYGPPEHANQDFQLNNGRIVMTDTILGEEVHIAQRNAIPIFGTGLFEFVSDATIIGLSDPDDLDGDGISGRFNQDSVGIGRFGVKAQSNNIELFTRGPLQNQMGITSDPHDGMGSVASLSRVPLLQAGSDPNASTRDDDSVPDPEISDEDLGDLIAFSRFLAPPQKILPFSVEAEAGELRFADLGCAKCHVPSLPSSRGPVEAYTDLLLHEMGVDLQDGIAMGTPQASSISSTATHKEFRTAPLWGVREVGPYLHDGRAATLEEAIQMHSGEAKDSKNAFEALTRPEKDELIAFLMHL